MSDDAVTYELANVDGLTLADVDAVLAAGGKFVVFEYVISFILLTFKSPSRVWLVHSDDEAQRLARRFSTVTWLCGWWALPYGILRSIEALRVNKGGGIDLTREVRGELTEGSLALGVVRFEDVAEVYLFFQSINTADLRDLEKCLAPVLQRHTEVSAVWAGKYPDPRDHDGKDFALCFELEARGKRSPLVSEAEPAGITVAMRVDDELRNECETALRKVFRKWVQFDYVAMDEGEMSRVIVKQCDAIYIRQK